MNSFYRSAAALLAGWAIATSPVAARSAPGSRPRDLFTPEEARALRAAAPEKPLPRGARKDGPASRTRGAGGPTIEVVAPGPGAVVRSPLRLEVRFASTVPVDPESVRIAAGRDIGPFAVTFDVTERLRPFGESGFTADGLSVSGGAYFFKIAVSDRAGNAAEESFVVTVE